MVQAWRMSTVPPPPPPGHSDDPDTRSFWVRRSTGLIATAIVLVGIVGSFVYFSVTSPNRPASRVNSGFGGRSERHSRDSSRLAWTPVARLVFHRPIPEDSMIVTRRRITATVVSIALVAGAPLLAGCGNAAESAIENAAGDAIGGDVDLDDGTLTVTSSDGTQARSARTRQSPTTGRPPCPPTTAER